MSEIETIKEAMAPVRETLVRQLGELREVVLNAVTLEDKHIACDLYDTLVLGITDSMVAEMDKSADSDTIAEVIAKVSELHG